MCAQGQNLPEPRHDAISQLNLAFGVELSDIGLIAPQTLDDPQILELGQTLRRIENASSWWIADFIVFVQNLMGSPSKSHGAKRREFYDRVLKIWPEYSRQTLITFASIARRVPAALRSPRLSFAHHVHIAQLHDEPQAADLQRHYIKAAEKTGATAEELRLMIVDTRKGILRETPIRGRPAKPIEISADRIDDIARPGADGKAPVAAESKAKDIEPEPMRGTHAQLAAEAERSLGRLVEWYEEKRRKHSVESWEPDRKQVLMEDLQGVLKQMHRVADIFNALTNAEQSGEYAQ